MSPGHPSNISDGCAGYIGCVSWSYLMGLLAIIDGCPGDI